MNIPFTNSYAALPPRFFTRQTAVPVRAPRLLKFNAALGAELGIPEVDAATLAQAFAGNTPLAGAEPLAQVYAGHQFGGFTPQLGDGRALLLGEVIDRHGIRRDIQLKGSGPTPYSRMGDGRAWLGPVLREYVVSEAMQALGVPTTRALAAVATGEPVYREEGGMPGAVLTRVATSHIRVGTFQYFAARRDMDGLRALYDYTVARHDPQAQSPDDLLAAVIRRQARLVAKWMSVGFIHGVMNTDNTAISGETIDYGPCAFMDIYDPQKVYSYVDAHGRYAYDNQAPVIVWNMAQFATALVPLMPDQDQAIETFTARVHAMPDLIEAERQRCFGRKIGIAEAGPQDLALVDELLGLMADARADFTNTFRGLIDGTAWQEFTDPSGFDGWAEKWRARLERETQAGADPEAVMRAANPAVVPRNHRVEQMIAAAVAGDLAPFERLLAALSDPYADRPRSDALRRPPEPAEIVQATFCGT